MRILQTILLATDLRPESRDVARTAVDIARVFGSSINLLHVLEPLPNWPRNRYEEKEQLGDQLRVFARDLAAEGVAVGGSVVEIGAPAPTIIRKAQELDAGLVVVGAGKPSFGAGTVAEAVLEHAVQPVLAVRLGQPRSGFQRIVCPVDHSAVSGRGLRNAIQLARAFTGHLYVLSVVPETSWLSRMGAASRTEHESRWREEFERFLAGIDFENVHWNKEVRRGDPAEEIDACAREQEADVIVMGSTGRTGLVRMLMGSVARRVFRKLPCALLTVKDEDAVEKLFEEDLHQAQLLRAEGIELLRNGCYLPALVKLRQVTAIDPFNLEALEGLADAHEKLGQLAEAEVFRRRVQRLRFHEAAPV